MNEIIIAIIGTGASVVALIYAFFRKFKSDNDKKLDGILSELKEINLKINDNDKRLYAVETVLHMKDCCVLKQDQNLKKAE